MSEVAQLTPGGCLNPQAEFTVLALGAALENQDDPLSCDGVAVGCLPARSAKYQPTADQPGVDANATREAVAPMLVDPVTDAEPEPRAAVLLCGFHPLATDGHSKPPFFAGQSMGDQVHVPVPSRGLHLRGTVHNPPVLHRIGPERLPEPHPVMGPVPAIHSGSSAGLSSLVLRRFDASDPLRQGHDRRYQTE